MVATVSLITLIGITYSKMNLNIAVLIDASNSFGFKDFSPVAGVMLAWISVASNGSSIYFYQTWKNGSIKRVGSFYANFRNNISRVKARGNVSKYLSNLKVEQCPSCSDIIASIEQIVAIHEDIDGIIVVSDGLTITPKFGINLERGIIGSRKIWEKIRSLLPKNVIITHIGYNMEKGVVNKSVIRAREFWKAVGVRTMDFSKMHKKEFWIGVFSSWAGSR